MLLCRPGEAVSRRPSHRRATPRLGHDANCRARAKASDSHREEKKPDDNKPKGVKGAKKEAKPDALDELIHRVEARPDVASLITLV